MKAEARLMANEIRAYREGRGWTLEKLAEMLGVTLQTVWRWEHGKSEPSKLAKQALRRLEVRV